MTELRSEADVASWLAAGLALRRVPSDPGASTSADDQAVGQAVGACAHELAGLPPPGMIADVAMLLAGARLPMPGPIAGGDALRAAIRAYDDDVLARLVTSARFDDAVAAFARLPLGDRAAAIAIVVGAICERSAFAGAAVSPATLRRALARPRADRDELARAALAGGPAGDQLADAYDRLARAARHTRALIDRKELFAIDHLGVLRDLGGRMTADHIGAAAEAFERTLPRRLPATRLARGADATQLADESQYPAGGFAAITPAGATANVENLVPSELAYMEDGPGPDVFTLRYIEGELLFYTRDDSVFRRHRQVIAIAIAPDLDDARVKDRDLPWQRLILALGLIVAAVRWLTEQLGDHALSIHVAFPPGALAEERAIVALLLDGELARGLVVVDDQPVDAALAAAAAESRSAIVDAIVLSLGAAPVVPSGLRALHIGLAAAAPVLAPIGGGGTGAASATDSDDNAAAGDAWAAWRDAAEDLLRWLV